MGDVARQLQAMGTNEALNVADQAFSVVNITADAHVIVMKRTDRIRDYSGY